VHLDRGDPRSKSGGRKKEALIVISGDHLVRNYLTSDAFVDLEKVYDCCYVGSEEITLRERLESKPGFLGYYHYDPDVVQRHMDVFSVLMWGMRHKSSTFRFRAMRTLTKEPVVFVPRRDVSAAYNALRYSRHLWRRLRAWSKSARFRIITSRPVLPLYVRAVTPRIPVNPFLFDVIDALRPALVIFPSCAYDAEGNDLARTCAHLRIPCLFLIDNWDNLSSKSVMWAKPSDMGVWGEQSVDHAVHIQGMPRNHVMALGTPRFDQYFRLRDTPLPSHFAYRYILFVGTALEFDEVSVIEAIDKTMADNPDLFSDVKLVYRPHPQRQGKHTIIGRTFEHVVIDPQMYEAYAEGRTGRSVAPDLAYYPSLLQNAEFVIGGLTSMLMETLVFGKRYLALVHNDGRNLTSQHNALKYYVHFRGLEDFDAVSFCDDLERLPELLVTTWQMRRDVDVRAVDERRMYYLYDDPTPYRLRLVQLVDDVVNGRGIDGRAPLVPSRPPVVRKEDAGSRLR
jgi:hypothetical protein